MSEMVLDMPMVAMAMQIIGGRSIRVGSNDLKWLLTWVSRSLCTYKSNMSICLMDKVTVEH